MGGVGRKGGGVEVVIGDRFADKRWRQGDLYRTHAATTLTFEWIVGSDGFVVLSDSLIVYAQDP